MGLILKLLRRRPGFRRWLITHAVLRLRTVYSPAMHPMSANLAVVIVAEERTLRNSQPSLTAAQVLDHVMRGRYGHRIDFGVLATPPSPFSLLVAEALDGGMLASDWGGLWMCNSQPASRRSGPSWRKFLPMRSDRNSWCGTAFITRSRIELLDVDLALPLIL